MKKIFSKEIFLLPLFLVITLFVSVNKVSAWDYFEIAYGGQISSSSTAYSYNYNQMKTFYEDNADVITTIFEALYNEYTQYYSIEYPYYWLGISDINLPTSLSIRFYASDILPTFSLFSSGISYISRTAEYKLFADASIDITNDTYSYITCASGVDPNIQHFCELNNYYNVNLGRVRSYDVNEFYADNYFFSNFSLVVDKPTDDQDKNVRFTSYTNANLKAYRYHSDWLSPSLIPTFYDFFNLTFLNDYKSDHFTEVNLNNYAYIVLSLKSYNTLISPVDFYVKGQSCITPVNNYGMTEKSNITDVCTTNYLDFTPVRYWIKNSDLSNHTVFYIAPYDITQENKIRIDTNVFDISYITSVNANAPTIEVNGQTFSIIPYSSLSNTAQNNEANGYIPGQTCAVGDPDCLYSNSGIDIDNLFTHPLQLLQSLWGSITQFFTIVSAFMTVLPTELQTFLYVGFMLAVVIGIIKIIIG